MGFAQGTLVLTDKGQLPIEDVEVGMRVLTHTGEWHEVVAVSREGATSTVVLKGHHFGLECTPNQQIYTATDVKNVVANKTWLTSKNAVGKRFAVPHKIEAVEVEPLTDKTFSTMNGYFYYFIGRFLADGWSGDKMRRVILCAGEKKVEKTEAVLGDMGVAYKVYKVGSVYRYTFSNVGLVAWLERNFGKYAYGKYLPSWVYGLSEDFRTALFNGIMDCDGYVNRDGRSLETTSKKLAVGMRLLGESLGFRTCMISRQREPAWCCKKVSTFRRTYTVSFFNSECVSEIRDDAHGWYKVKAVEESFEPKTVYSLKVEKDESFIADGVVVKA